MVLSDLFVSLMQVLTKPWFLIPIIGVLLVSSAVLTVNSWALERPFTDFVLYYNGIPNDNLIGVLLFNYPLELAALVISGLVISVVGMVGAMSVVRMAKGSGFAESINESAKQWGKSLAIIVIFWAGFFLFSAIYSVITSLADINQIIGLVVAAVFFIILFVVAVKVVFTIPALSEKDTKKAVQESWKFTNKKFWGTVALVLLALLIGLVGTTLITQLGMLIGSVFEIPLAIIGEAFGSAYFIAAITNYFYAKQ